MPPVEGKHDQVCRDLTSTMHSILHKSEDCRYECQDDQCVRCQERDVRCVCLSVVHIYSDMRASQCMAHGRMQATAPYDIQDAKYVSYGF